MTTNLISDQVRMMNGFGDTVDVINEGQTERYLHMMVEELGETLVAANPKAKTRIGDLIAYLHGYVSIDHTTDVVEFFDGLTDVKVVTLGAGVSFNLPIQQGWDTVWGSNMAKINHETGLVIRNEAGKVQKPPGWVKPDLASVLRAAGRIA